MMSHDADKHFQKALERLLAIEGGLSDIHGDPGGMTWRGISRVYWPSWEGWQVLDQDLAAGRDPSDDRHLADMVATFYRLNFWDRFSGDRICAIETEIAAELFEASVNVGVHRASSWLQEAINLLNRNQQLYHDLVVDGLVGPHTLGALAKYYSYDRPPHGEKTTMLLTILNVLQGSYYIEQMRRYPERENFRGWFLRL